MTGAFLSVGQHTAEPNATYCTTNLLSCDQTRPGAPRYLITCYLVSKHAQGRHGARAHYSPFTTLSILWEWLHFPGVCTSYNMSHGVGFDGGVGSTRSTQCYLVTCCLGTRCLGTCCLGTTGQHSGQYKVPMQAFYGANGHIVNCE